MRIRINELSRSQKISSHELRGILGGTTFRVNSQTDSSTIIKKPKPKMKLVSSCDDWEWVPWEESNCDPES